jgi:hypothetical protein
MNSGEVAADRGVAGVQRRRPDEKVKRRLVISPSDLDNRRLV